MIFCGDTVFPYSYSEGNLSVCSSDFWCKKKIVNLECSLNFAVGEKRTRGIALKSDKSIVKFFDEAGIQCVSVANNHMFDYEIDLDAQIEYFHKNNIALVGAGRNVVEAASPYYCKDENLLVLSFGWDVIGCKYAGANIPGVNPYEYDWVVKQVHTYRRQYKSSTVVTIFHWNYELEQYPQPADREFALHLIDVGVDAIVGHHSHLVQGFEIYKDKPIFYGLGNFYFPNTNYSGYDVDLPSSTSRGLCVDIANNHCKAYITKLSRNKVLSVLEEGGPDELEALVTISNFQGLTQNEYIDFFKANRKKKKLLPIYKSYKNVFTNSVFDKFVKGRQYPVDLIGKLRGYR